MPNNTSSDPIWYALGCTSPQRELKVRDDARRYGLEAFVPLKYEVKKVKGRDQRLLVPAITQLIFVKGTLDEVQDYIAHAHYVVYIQRSTFSNHKDYLTVPVKAMENFIAVTENTERRITYFRPDEITLREGDQIRIRGGLYDGREGIIMRIKGKRNRHLVVQIPGILIAAIEMSPDMIEPSLNSKLSNSTVYSPSLKSTVSNSNSTVYSRKSLKSKDLDKDKRLLFDLSHRLLFEIPDKYQNENEYYLLRSELSRAKDRLQSFRGYTPATEADFALPLFMASVVLEEDLSAPQARLQKAISGLKPTSLLRVKCLIYLSVLSHDPVLASELSALFTAWRRSPLSANQRSLLDEFTRLCG